jgi:hypothetical protein
MAFGVATVLTKIGEAITADRVGAAGTYTTQPKYCGHGHGATGAARTAISTDTALTTEVDTRATGVVSLVTVTDTNDTYQAVGTISVGGTYAIDEAGLFDASSSGNMFTSATFNVLNVVSGNSIAYTWKVSYIHG